MYSTLCILYLFLPKVVVKCSCWAYRMQTSGGWSGVVAKIKSESGIYSERIHCQMNSKHSLLDAPPLSFLWTFLATPYCSHYPKILPFCSITFQLPTGNFLASKISKCLPYWLTLPLLIESHPIHVHDSSRPRCHYYKRWGLTVFNVRLHDRCCEIHVFQR